MSISHRLSLVVAAALTTTIAAAGSHAAVTYSSVNITGASDIVNLGTTVVDARNMGDDKITIAGHAGVGGATPTYNFNGIDFVPDATPFPEWSTSAGTVSQFDGGGTFLYIDNSNESFEEAMNSVISAGGATESLTLTLSGLTPGQAYHLQMIMSERRFVRSATMTIQGEESALFETGVAGPPAVEAIGMIAVFTATGTSETVLLSNASNVDVAAWALQTIPEPASAALLGLGGTLMMVRRRRA